MNNSAILEKAISKAIENGWLNQEGAVKVNRLVTANRDNHVQYEIAGVFFGSIYEVIFSHDFAKALWGEEDIDKTMPWTSHQGPITYYAFEAAEDITATGPAYLLHLQQMVISPDPLEYLKDNMPE